MKNYCGRDGGHPAVALLFEFTLFGHHQHIIPRVGRRSSPPSWKSGPEEATLSFQCELKVINTISGTATTNVFVIFRSRSFHYLYSGIAVWKVNWHCTAQTCTKQLASLGALGTLMFPMICRYSGASLHSEKNTADRPRRVEMVS